MPYKENKTVITISERNGEVTAQIMQSCLNAACSDEYHTKHLKGYVEVCKTLSAYAKLMLMKCEEEGKV